MLINQYHLSTEQPLIVGFTQQLIAQWHYLPQISFLIACQRHRAILSRQGLLQRFRRGYNNLPNLSWWPRYLARSISTLILSNCWQMVPEK